MSTIHILLTGNDTVLQVERLRNDSSGADINDADVSVTLLDAGGTPVTGLSWPLALAPVTGSRGGYRVTLPATLPLVRDARYTARVQADGGAGQVASWDLDCVARART